MAHCSAVGEYSVQSLEMLSCQNGLEFVVTVKACDSNVWSLQVVKDMLFNRSIIPSPQAPPQATPMES